MISPLTRNGEDGIVKGLLGVWGVTFAIALVACGGSVDLLVPLDGGPGGQASGSGTIGATGVSGSSVSGTSSATSGASAAGASAGLSATGSAVSNPSGSSGEHGSSGAPSGSSAAGASGPASGSSGVGRSGAAAGASGTSTSGAGSGSSASGSTGTASGSSAAGSSGATSGASGASSGSSGTTSGASGCNADVDTDPQNCGACGNVCALPNATQACKGGDCAIGTCSRGYKDCDHSSIDGCEIDVDTDPNNCSACGYLCVTPHATPECTAGSCAIMSCKGPYMDCNGVVADGCEVDVNSDSQNCGSCNNVCALPNATSTCEGGSCAITGCSNGYKDCNGMAADGCEAMVATDPQNCGSCGNACFGNDVCVGGFCLH
jgi:hypothetical protein